jgi:hypothetical protein
MIALPLASPEPFRSSDGTFTKKQPITRDRAGLPDNDPADWTCYSSGAYTTDWVARAAEDPAAPTDILSMLAESCNTEVRMAVADNPSALLETLTMLAQDDSADVRYQMAENHNIDQSILKMLSEDSHPYIAHRAQKTLRRLEVPAKVVPIMSIASRANLERRQKFEETDDLVRKIAAQAIQASVMASRKSLE